MESLTEHSAVRDGLSQVCRKINEISTLPHVALRVVEVANDPNSGARELKAVMESDVSLSTRVLRCVNSSAYAMRTKVTNLQQAIAFLGVMQIRNLALTASVSRLFQDQQSIGSYRRDNLWRHLVTVGVCARLIAMRSRMAAFEDVFLAGLLHDIGIALEDEHQHAGFVSTIQAIQPSETLLATEQRHLGFDHTRLGEAIAQQWKLPKAVVDSVRHHHNSEVYRGEHLQTVRCVEAANFLCSLKGITSVGINLVQFPQKTIQALAFSKEDLLVLSADLDREQKQNQALFQI